MHPLAERLLQTIREQQFLRAGDRLAVAVSGGADSVALLRLLLEIRAQLGVVLSVAHVNHQLRGSESDGDQSFVEALAREHGLEFHLCAQAVAVGTGTGVEAAARATRYSFFRELTAQGQVSKIATAHTLDDQAETVLLRLFRGTGIQGLSGILPRLALSDAGRASGEVFRPLLGTRRAELLQYLREQHQSWREDSSNRSMEFLRNRVRHHLLPQIVETFGAAAVERMGELAEIARAEEEHWQSVHPEIGALTGHNSGQNEITIQSAALLALPLAAQRRIVKSWISSAVPGARISFRLIEEVLDAARGPAGRTLEVPGGWSVQRRRDDLLLEKTKPAATNSDYEYDLPVPGQVEVRELGLRLEARLVDVSQVPEEQRAQLLDPARLPEKLLVRNWRAGDHYWPAHTSSEKKVKDLLSRRHQTGPAKKLWPVAADASGRLVWMRGFAVPAAVAAPEGASRAIWIRDTPA